MKKQRNTALVAFFIVCLIGLVLTVGELILSLLNSSLCISDGCKVVAESTRYGSMSIVIPGILAFLALTLLAARKTFYYEKSYDSAISIILNVALATEGFLVGYQAFRLYAPCTFCLGVFAILVIAGGLWFLAGQREIASGFASLIVIFLFMYLILPVPGGMRGAGGHSIGENTLTLFYDESCSSCREIDTLCKECDIHINKLEANENAEFLNYMDIKQLPVLVVNNGSEKKIIIGAEQIEDYLLNIHGED